MTKTWTNEMIIDFINEVHQHSECWKFETEVYRDKSARKDGWNAIATKFGISSEEAYKKFRSLRTYAKNEKKKRKSGTAGDKPIKWFAYDAISFILTQNYLPHKCSGCDTKIATNIPDNDPDPPEDINLKEDVVDTQPPDCLPMLEVSPLPRAKKTKTTDAVLEITQNKPKINTSENTHRPNITSNTNKSNTSETRNELAGFGEHVVNKLSKYDDYTRAQAELRIMQVLFEFDMQMLRDRAPSNTQSNKNRNRSDSDNSQSDLYPDVSLHHSEWGHIKTET